MTKFENEVTIMKLKTRLKNFTAIILSFSLIISCASFSDAKKCSAEETYDYQALADEIVILVNEARIENGLKPLYAVPVLHEFAYVRSTEIVDLFDHYRPDGRFFDTLFDELEITHGNAAENIAAGSSSAERTFSQWKNSPYHWVSIINPEYTHIGVAMYYDPDKPYRWYWEQIFIQSPYDNKMDGQYLPERYPVKPISCGDINGDGQVNSLDLVLLRKYIKNEAVLNDLQIKSADCMEDGEITSADLKTLKNYLLGKCSTLPFAL